MMLLILTKLKIFLVGVIAILMFVAPSKPEFCKHNADGDYICVWTENESHFEFGVRVMIDNKPASHQRVFANVTTNSIAGYTCETATTKQAFCKFGQSTSEIYSIRVEVANTHFTWHNGSWQ